MITTVAASLAGPAGLAIDAAGDLFVAAQNGHRIQELIGVATPGLF